MTVPATEALAALREGNRRFAAGADDGDAIGGSGEQAPIAAVLGCSDSRVPIERIFQQGAGRLFVVRVAGNIVGPSQIGSIELAVEELGASLVVVLGHSRCGAVMAAIEDFRGSSQARSPDLQAIVDAVRPSVEAASRGLEDLDRLLERSVRANIRASMAQLLEGSALLADRAGSGELLIVGAEYSLETGIVEFLE